MLIKKNSREETLMTMKKFHKKNFGENTIKTIQMQLQKLG